MRRPTVPDSPSIASSCAVALFNWLRDKVEKVEPYSSRSDGRRGPRLIAEQGAPGRGGRLKIQPSYSLGTLEADFAFVDECSGFIGLFKAYNTMSWGEGLLADLHLAAIVHQEQVLECLAKDEDPRDSHWPERPWTVYLFALVPSEDDPDKDGRQLQDVWQDIRKGRLIEEVGLSLLFCSEHTLEDVKTEARSPEVRRFLAPLLIHVRDWGSQNEDKLEGWRQKLLEELAVVGGGTAYSPDVSKWVKEKITERVKPLLRMGSASARIRLRSLKNIGLRRVAGSESLPLPFEDLTLLYGHNGSGKSTLLEAVELALTGRLERFERFAAMKPNDVGDLESLYSKALESKAVKSQVSGDCTFRGELEVVGQDLQTHTEESSRGVITLPVQYRLLNTSEQDVGNRSKPVVPAMTSFYLRQGEVRRFVEMSADERYSWMVELLGVPADKIGQALNGLHKEVRLSVDERWRRITGRGMAASAKNSVGIFATEAKQLLTIFTGWTGQLEDLETELRLTSKSQPWMTEDLMERLWNVVERGKKLLDDAKNAVSEVESSLRSSQRGVHAEDVTPAITACRIRSIMEQCQTLFEYIGATMKELKEPYERVEDAIRAAQQQIDQWKSMDRPSDHSIAPEDLEELKRQLSAIRTARQGVDTVLGLISSFESLVNLSVSLERQLSGFSAQDLFRLHWAGQPMDWQDRLEEMHKDVEKARPSVVALASLRGHGEMHKGYFEGVRNELKDIESRLLGRIRSVRSLSGVKCMVYDGDADWKEHLEAILNFARQVGIDVTRDSVDSPEGLMPIIDLLKARLELVDKLDKVRLKLVSLSDDERVHALLGELDNWNVLADDWNSCGLGPLLSLLDQVARQKDSTNEAVCKAVEELLETEVGDLWQELIWTFTAYSWNQPCPRFKFQSDRSHSRTHVDTEYGPAALVFNMAEQSIVGLAWFFTSYLLAGRQQSSAIILDDPFQSLDDVNLSAFVRIFDDVLRVLGAQQVIIALHQPSIYEYLRMEFAGGTVSGRSSAGSEAQDVGRDSYSAVALWEVEADELTRSKVDVEVLKHRSPAPRFSNLVGERDCIAV